VVDAVEHLSELVGSAERLLTQVQHAQEAFRVGDVAAASQTMNGLAGLVDQIQDEVDLLINALPPVGGSV
jgi:hypothetical protein